MALTLHSLVTLQVGEINLFDRQCFMGLHHFMFWTIEEIFPVDFPHSILDLRMMIALGTYRSLGHMVIKSNFLTCLVASGFHQEGTK